MKLCEAPPVSAKMLVMDEPRTSVLGNAPAIPLARVDLIVVEGPDQGLTANITSRVRIGTSPTCELRLSDPSVSRIHCTVNIERGVLQVTDLESTNGTYVDGVRVRDADVQAGSTLRIGKTALRVDVGEEPVLVNISTRDRFGDLVGSSVEMRSVYSVMERVAPTDITVLVQGETGTGKEVAARAIHQMSKRASGPFVAVDCGGIAENLIESELFGHARGAFTGAVGERRGLAEDANGGTLFLDEIGELPLALQPKLLRLLETREVRPVGGNAPKRVDVRIVAATHRSLAESVNRGTFREDLYYRLAVVETVLPPLRARRDDIVALARHFWKRFADAETPFPDGLVATLMNRSWPGNVRELRNFIERTVALGWAQTHGRPAAAAPVAAPPGLDSIVPSRLPLHEARRVWGDQFETLYLTAILRAHDGNVTRAAEAAGINRRSLQRMMIRLGLRGDVDGAEDE